jgi:large subunit ribosomal protein L4
MKLDVVNSDNKKVGSLELKDEVFGVRVNTGLIWESVVHANAADRHGTHATKTRGNVAGSGRKPWRQKGTGRARVGEVRNPLWRKGGTVFGPQPRSYDYALPRKVELGALRAAMAQRAQEGALVAIDALVVEDGKTKSAVELLSRLGADGKTLLVDVTPDESLTLAVRNLPKVALVRSGRLRARDVMNATRVIATSAAIERLQTTLG